MNVLQSIWQWVTTHSGISIVVGLVGLYFAVVLLTILYQRFGFYSWYLLVILAAVVGALTTELSSYFIVFLLGMITAFAEIISKFRDEPLKALEMPHALFYHLTDSLPCLRLSFCCCSAFRLPAPRIASKRCWLPAWVPCW
jgi:hypothetical protein